MMPKEHDKQSEKKRELARHTLSVLADLGTARLNLREVASRSGTALGTIHYYFADKNELLIYCLRLYKDDFIRQLEQVIGSSDGADDLRGRMASALAAAIEKDAVTHRLWYDVRAQALFDPLFQPLVEDIEHRLIGVAEQILVKVNASLGRTLPIDALNLYLALDAWFRYALQQHIAGNPNACDDLQQRLLTLLPL